MTVWPGLIFVSVVAFVFCYLVFTSCLSFFGDGAIFSDVDDPESFDDIDVPLSSRLVSDWNSIPLVGVLGAGRPPVLFPVAFRMAGLCCSSRVIFTGSPDASSLNMGCHGALGFSVSVLFCGRLFIVPGNDGLR